MDWNEIITNVVVGVVGILLTYAISYLGYFIQTKVKNEKLKKMLSEGLDVVTDGVDYIYQTYVENLKGTDLWDDEAREKANSMALKYIEEHLTPEMKKYLAKNSQDISEWAKTQIEIAIKKSKELNKK